MTRVFLVIVVLAFVFAIVIADMTAKDASAEQTNQVACVKLYEAAPKPWCQPLPPNYYAPKP